MNAKNIIIVVLALVLIGSVGYLLFNSSDNVVVIEDTTNGTDPNLTTNETEEGIDGDTELGQVKAEERGDESTIGKSVEGKDIIAYHFGSGDKEILLVGGSHGGYSPNTAALASEFVAYFKKNEASIPSNLMVTVIPNLNPDGTDKSGTAGRFNANKVDINRNFDCEWSAEAVWRNQNVSGGTEAFSEPEAQALRDYVQKYDPASAIVWFSAEGKVYPSACAATPSKASIDLAATFATAAKYPAEAEFDAYAITGDMVNWMAKEGIPAISVLLSDYKNTEWTKNLAGVEAVMNKYAE